MALAKLEEMTDYRGGNACRKGTGRILSQESMRCYGRAACSVDRLEMLVDKEEWPMSVIWGFVV